MERVNLTEGLRRATDSDGKFKYIESAGGISIPILEKFDERYEALITMIESRVGQGGSAITSPSHIIAMCRDFGNDVVQTAVNNGRLSY